MAFCKDCKEDKDKSEFYPDKTNSTTGIRTYCKKCTNIRSKKFRANNLAASKRWVRKSKLKLKFGISPEAAEKLIDATINGVCEICAKHEYHNNKQALSIDHDHATGKIRGVLCHRCNLFVGFCNEDIALLEAAIVYLKKYKA